MQWGPARIAYAIATVVVALAGCYDVPRPECGFTCGPPAVEGGEGTCPDGYVCFTSVDNRCHRVSPPFTDTCPGDAAVPVDLRPPQLTLRSPAPDAENVAITMTGFVNIAFDEPVARIMDFGSFVVEDPTGEVPGFIVELGQMLDGYFHYQYQSQRPFFPDTIHTVRLGTQITDFSNNNFLGAEWMFRTEIDDDPPTAFVQIPTIMTNVPVTTFVEVEFSEPVVGVNTSTFTLTGPSGGVSATFNMSVSTLASLDPVGSLMPNTQYTVNLSSAITDVAGNPLSFTPFVFTTAQDTTSPSVTSVNPFNNQTNVSVIQSVGISFTEAVVNVDNTTFTLTGPSGTETALVTTSPTTATLNPVYQLSPNTTYNVAASTAITDAVGNPLVAFASMFTTGLDNVVPSVLARFPINGATNVPVDSVVRVDFDEHVTNVDETTFQLMNGGAIAGTVVYQGPPARSATLTPASQLVANTTYMVVLASTIQDPSGNMFGTPPSAWTFMTGPDTVVPSVTTTAPTDGMIDVPLDATISVTFDEPVTGVDGTSFVVMNAGTGTLVSSNGGRTWTFTPDAPMPASTTVTIMLTMAIEDTAGNDLTPFAFSFTTVP